MSFDGSRGTTADETSRTSNSLDGGNKSSIMPPTPSKAVDQPQINISDAERTSRLNDVLQSDIGVNTLLNRLKQSISSTNDFAGFLKKRSTLEEEHAQGLKRLGRGTHDLIRRPENRQGSFAQSYEEITRVHDRMSEHGLQFSSALHQMSNDLSELAANVERGRKQWKHDSGAATKKVQDSEGALEKAKTKYDSLAEQYDRARTGDRQTSKFGIKGPKSAAQQEEDLQRKVQAADADYYSKVNTAQVHRQEHVSQHRPQALKALQELIAECDSGLSLQIQRFASLQEKLLLGNGLCVSPLKSQTNGATSGPKSLREIAGGVNNEKDLDDYVLGFANKAGSKPPEIKYEKHPALASPKQAQPPQFPPSQSQPSFTASQPQFGSQGQRAPPPSGFNEQGHRPTTSGQMTGVTSYGNSQSSRDGPGIQTQPGQYAQPPQGPMHQHSGSQPGQVPQIPPIAAMSGGLNSNPSNRSEILSAGPNNEHRAIVSPVNQNAPLTQPMASRPNNVTSPGSSGGPNNYPSFNQQQGPPADSRLRSGSGPAPAPMGLNVGSGLPSMGQQTGREPTSMGQPTRREPPSMGQQTGRGLPSIGQQTGRGLPSMGQQNNFQQNNNGPPYGPSGGFRPQAQNNMPYENRGGPQNNRDMPLGPNGAQGAMGAMIPGQGPSASSVPQPRRSDNQRNLPPLNPVFGVSLDELFRRDNSAVPMIVYQCVQAVDLFGLDVEGIYRTSGSAPHIMEMKAVFDNDSSQVDFRNPASFHHDIASVTTLLKHFLRDLPDPLLTAAQYSSFIQAAQIDDDISRRDSLHAVINSLPDPNYATLRVLTLHLARVAEHSARNRMTPSNLAICFGPTLLVSGSGRGGGGHGSGDIRDAGWQARVVETILTNTFQIFDDDD